VALRRRGLVVGLLVFILILAVFALWRNRRPSRSLPKVAAFSHTGVPLASPDLALELSEVRGDPSEGALDWRCIFVCQEPDGCHADVVVTVHYQSSGEARQTQFSDTLHIASGTMFRIGGLKPPTSVKRVDRVDVRVDRAFSPGDPLPTPEL
jgi:hypothetical protein